MTNSEDLEINKKSRPRCKVCLDIMRKATGNQHVTLLPMDCTILSVTWEILVFEMGHAMCPSAFGEIDDIWDW